MAVQGKEQLLLLLKRFLASTINPSQTDTGEYEDEKGFENAKQIMALALLTDTGAIFSLLKIAAEDYKAVLQSHVSDIDGLLSTEGLFGVGSSTIESVSVAKLKKASSKIQNLTSNPSKAIGDEASALLESFLREEMLNISLVGSTRRSIKNIKDFEAKLSLAWADIVSKKESLYKIAANFSKDTLIEGALEKAVGIMANDTSLAAHLLTIGGPEDYALISKTIELLTAGTKAFLDFIFTTEDPLGTTIVDPSQGWTPFIPEKIQGTGTLTAGSYVARGDNGRIFLDFLMGSSSGYATNLPLIDKKAKITTGNGPFDLSDIVDPSTNKALIYFNVDDKYEIELEITTSELLDTGNWTTPYAVTPSELYLFIVNKYGFTWTTISLGYTSSSVYFFTMSSDKNKSILEILANSSAAFLSALGIEAEVRTTGKSISTKFQDTNITTSSASWNDAPVSLRTDGNETYHLLTQTDSSIQEITSITPSNLFIEISPGIEESSTNVPYAITVEPPGTYIQPAKNRLGSITQVPVRKPPTASNYLGEELSGGFIIHEGKQGKIQTTVLTLPNYDESLSSLKGSVWNGYGTSGYWKPIVKSRGKFSHCRTFGQGVPSPLKAAGNTSNYIRPGLNRNGSSNHSNHFYSTGVLGKKSSTVIYNALIDLLVPSPPVTSSDLEATCLYFRDSSSASASPVAGIGFGPQVVDFKIGDYFRISSSDAGGDGVGLLTNTSNYTSGSVGANVLNNGHRIREIRNWYPTHGFSSLQFLPPLDLPLGINLHSDSLLDTNFGFKANLGAEIDGINIDIIHAHKFVDTNANFITDGIAPGDVIILHEQSLGVASYITSNDFIPNDSSLSTLTGTAQEEGKQQFDTSWIKAFEVAYVQDANTIFINTGWATGAVDIGDGKNNYNTPFTTNSGILDIPQPAFTTDAQFPYNNAKDGYNCWYQVLRRGATNYATDSAFSGDAIPNLLAFMDSDYYTLYQISPSTFKQDTTPFYRENGSAPTFAEANIQKGDILKVTNVGTDNYGDGTSSYRTKRGTELEDIYMIFSAQDKTLQAYRVDNSGVDQEYTVEYAYIPTNYPTIYQKPQGFDFYSEDFEYVVYSQDHYKRFYCEDAQFITSGVTAGMTLKITSGTYVGTYTIESVESETAILTTAEGVPGDAGFNTAGLDYDVNFLILVDDNVVFNPDATFQSDGIQEDDIFVFRTSAGVIHEILVDSVTDQNTLVLKSNLPETQFITDRYYLIKKKADADGIERTNQFAVVLGAGGFTTSASAGGFDDLPALNTLKLRPINLTDPSIAEEYEEPVHSVTLRVQESEGSDNFIDFTAGVFGGLGWYSGSAYTNDHISVLLDEQEISTLDYAYDSNGLYVTPGSDASANLDWVFLMGVESPFFEDTSKTFTSDMEGDRITINPGVVEYSSLSPYDISTGKEFVAEIKDVISPTVIKLNRKYPVESSDGKEMTGYWTGAGNLEFGSEVLPTGDIVMWLEPENITTTTTTTTTSISDENILTFHGAGGVGTDGNHNNVNSYLRVPNNVGVPSPGQGWSFSMWTRIPAISEFNNSCVLLTVFDDTSVTGVETYILKIALDRSGISGGRIVVNAQFQNTATSYTANDLYFDNIRVDYAGQWVHMCFTWDGDITNIFTTFKVYINGLSRSLSSYTSRNVLAYFSPNRFSEYGRRVLLFSPIDNTSGNISDCHRFSFNEVALWDVELSSGEVSESYNSGDYYPASEHSQAGNLAEYWAFNSSDTNTFIATNSISIQGEIGSNHLTNSFTGIQGYATFQASAGFGSSTYTQSTSVTVVSSWADSSGNVNNATQSAGSNSPGILTSALNGYSAVTFDGVNDFLQVSDADSLDMNTTDGTMVAMVLRYTAYQANGVLSTVLSKGDSSPQYRFGMINDTAGSISAHSFVSTEGTGDGDDYSVGPGAWLVIVGSSSSLARYGVWTTNGTVYSSDITTDVGSASTDILTIGALSTGGDAASVQIVEVMLFDAVLDERDRQIVEGYLGHKYNITLDSSHPYYSSAPVFTGELFGGKAKLPYSRLPQDYPQPGMEFLSDGGRYLIDDIVFASNANFVPSNIDSELPFTIDMKKYTPALKLAQTVNLNTYTKSSFFIVRKGEDPFLSEFTASSIVDRFGTAIVKGFRDYDRSALIGRHIVFETGEWTTIRGIKSRDTLIVDSIYRYVPSNVGYRISIESPDNTLQFFTNQTPSGTAATGDYLSVWTVNTPCTVDTFVDQATTTYNEAYYSLDVPGIISGLPNTWYTVSRDGDPNYGHFVLFKFLLDRVSLSQTFLGETLYLSEVVNQGGTDYAVWYQSLTGSPVGTSSVANTIQADSSSYYIVLGDATPGISSSIAGQKLSITYYNSSTQKYSISNTFVKTFDSATNTAELYSPIKVTSSTLLIVDWELSDGSVCEAIRRLQEIKDKFSDIITLIDQYQPQTTDAVLKVLKLLEDQGLDRAAQILREGSLEELLTLSYDRATYSGNLASTINELGKLL